MFTDILEYNDNKIYLTDKVLHKFRQISDYNITLVDAPTGFGKTTAIKYFTGKLKDTVHWINITSSSKEIFWADFCDVFSEISSELETNLRTLEYPASEKAVVMIRNQLKKIKLDEDLYVIVDNYHLVGDGYFDMLISSMINAIPKELHLVFITQTFVSPITYELVVNNQILHISKEDFGLTQEDIVEFFKLYNLTITDDEAASLYNFSEGWISAIYLQLIHYAETGEMENCQTINELIEQSVWSKLSEDEGNFMMALSFFDSFTLNDAKNAAKYFIPDNNIEQFLGRILFVRFDKESRLYYIHHIFREYLKKEFEQRSEGEHDKIIVIVGSIYEHKHRLFDAYKLYYKAKEWESIYKTVPSFVALYPYINSENKEFFLEIINDCPEEIADKYHYFSILMSLVLFMYNEKDRLVEYIMNIVYSIEEDKGLNEKQKKDLYGTVYYVRGYTEFNNISMMNMFYRKSLDYAGSPVIDLTAKVPFTFGCPSVLHLFHREGERLDKEIESLNECMPAYYKLSEGHGKGAEALMKAEMLYNQGDFDGAEALCHKALYMADSREQTCITLSALLLLNRMSVFDGDYDTFNEKMEAIRKKVKFANSSIDTEYINMIDMCESCLYSLTENPDKISEWLKSWETIENRINLISMSYANIIYGKWLFLKKEYQKFLGISGQFLGVASIYSNAMPKIYTYIYISMANAALENEEKAVKFLLLALETAMPDNIYMPFVENSIYIENIIESVSCYAENRDFIKKVNSISKKYNAGLKSIKKNAHNKDNYGLTDRELDVARLASLRLSNKEIAEKLFIAESTVKSNMKVIFSKLGINSRSKLSDFFK